jgi:hypothetical protein
VNTVVVGNVKCRRCSYNLRGLIASGKCPECATPVWDSVQATVDQELLHLPTLKHPKLVGDGLFLFVLGVMLSVLLFAAYPMAQRLDAWDPSGLRQYSDWLPARAWLWQVVLGLVSLAGVILMAPRRGSGNAATSWRDIRLSLLGMALWWGASIWADCSQANSIAVWRQLAQDYSPLVNMAGAWLMLWGLRGILNDIGQRSRAYRTSESGRQSTTAMLATLGAMVIGRALQVIAGAMPHMPRGIDWRELIGRIGTTLVWVGGVMLMIGLAYLMMNAWWIRRALYKPSPWYGQLLMPPLPQQTVLGDDGTSFEVRIKADEGGSDKPKGDGGPQANG